MASNLILPVQNQLENFYLSYQKDGSPISVNFRTMVPELKSAERYTHLIHSYPAKLLTHIPYFFLSTDILCPQNGIVLDPFCGTGTVLLEAALSGRNALGADANPLAELISVVKVSYLPKETLSVMIKSILIRAKRLRRTFCVPKAVAIWYSPNTLKQLSALQTAILELGSGPEKAFFELCLSNVAKKVSYADPSISVPVHWNPERFDGNEERKKEVIKKLKQLEAVNVYDKFETICNANIARVETLKGQIKEGVTTQIVSNDARNLGLDDNSVDFILTSPPYAGAQKYIRASWLNLYWLNRVKLDGIRELKTHNIGREDYCQNEIKKSYTGIETADKVLKELYESGNIKRAFLAANYLNEMKDALDESYRVLKQGSYMVIVIGNNTVCKRHFDTQDYLTTYLVGKGMHLQYKLIDDIKSYGLMTKRNKTADKISREWILVFKK